MAAKICETCVHKDEYIKKNDVIKLIQDAIEDLKDNVINDVNMYNSHIDKEIHDEKCQYAIDELVDINNEVVKMKGIFKE